MAEQKKIQLYTDRACTVEASPETSAKCVILSDGNDLQKVLDNDLTNPTVVHEETSFKVGVGDINVSSSVVDGEVGRMVIKGKTYQNILPEPSTHVLTNNKEMFKVNEGLDPNVEIVDGVSKSAILSGQTLVNLISNNTVSVNGGESNWKSYGFLSYTLTSGEKYLVKAKFTENTINHENGVTMLFRQVSSNGSTQYVPIKNLIKNGYMIVTIDSDKPSIDNISIYANSNATSGSLTLKNLLIMKYQEGMENWDIPYFEGIQSVKMPVLCTTGKNLFDSSTEIVTGQGINSTNGLPYNASSHSCTGFLRVKSNTTYTITQSHNRTWVFAYNKNKEYIKVVKTDILSGGNFTTPNDTYYIRLDFNTANTSEIVNGVQIEEGSVATSYEPYKTNILSTPEDLELRRIGNIKDKLNLMTGELTQGIGEIVLNGQENWRMCTLSYQPTDTNYINYDLDVKDIRTSAPILCDTIKVRDWTISSTEINSRSIAVHSTNKFLRLCIEKSIAPDVESLKTYLSTNMAKVQYQLETPVVKTVDLSTSGNWEKVILDGSEDIVEYLSGNFVYYSYGNSSITNVLPYASGGRAFANHTLTGSTGVSNLVTNYKYIVAPKTTGTTGLCFSLDGSMTAEEAKAFLSQNPITVWYQTTTHQDSTQVKQPIFFKDGHIQLSSGADKSLIPTLDYQAKTSNSYVMDLMKANTRYTMKAKSASGNFTLGGSSYSLGTNRVFSTTGAAFNANNMMVVTGSYEDLMILEGDVTDKTIPYFKGIKSAFEDESKIEVLSHGKNLFNMNRRYDKLTNAQATVVQSLDKITVSSAESGTYVNANFILDKDLLKGKTVTGSCLYESDEKSVGTVQINYADSSGKWYYQQITRPRTFTFPKDFMGDVLLCVYANNTNTSQSNTVTVKNIQLEFGTKSTPYEPYKSNNTKIPLLSSLQTVVEDVHMTQGSLDNTTGVELVDTTCVRSNFIEVVEDTPIAFRNGGLERMAHILAYDSKKRYVEKLGIVSSCSIPQDKDIKYVRIFMNANNYEKLTIRKYIKAYNGLASLPNGVCDELIVDRTKKKATLIQRIKSTVFNGSEDWNSSSYSHDKLVEFVYHGGVQIAHTVFSDRFATGGVDVERVAFSGRSIYIRILKTKASNVDSFKKWLSQNPLTVQYGLNTPVITEVDLEGFPYIYKDGHIFLNSEIAPVVEIDYNVNQSQQIQANNETLQRHELDILDLDNLIVSFVNAEYNLRLLKFNMELSMMALAE